MYVGGCAPVAREDKKIAEMVLRFQRLEEDRKRKQEKTRVRPDAEGKRGVGPPQKRPIFYAKETYYAEELNADDQEHCSMSAAPNGVRAMAATNDREGGGRGGRGGECDRGGTFVQKRPAASRPDFEEMYAHKGVRLRESGRWEARVCFKGKKKYVGLYDSAKLAAAAYDAALAKIKEATQRGRVEEEEATQGEVAAGDASLLFSLSALRRCDRECKSNDGCVGALQKRPDFDAKETYFAEKSVGNGARRSCLRCKKIICTSSCRSSARPKAQILKSPLYHGVGKKYGRGGTQSLHRLCTFTQLEVKFCCCENGHSLCTRP